MIWTIESLQKTFFVVFWSISQIFPLRFFFIFFVWMFLVFQLATSAQPTNQSTNQSIINIFFRNKIQTQINRHFCFFGIEFSFLTIIKIWFESNVASDLIYTKIHSSIYPKSLLNQKSFSLPLNHFQPSFNPITFGRHLQMNISMLKTLIYFDSIKKLIN